MRGKPFSVSRVLLSTEGKIKGKRFSAIFKGKRVKEEGERKKERERSIVVVRMYVCMACCSYPTVVCAVAVVVI